MRRCKTDVQRVFLASSHSTLRNSARRDVIGGDKTFIGDGEDPRSGGVGLDRGDFIKEHPEVHTHSWPVARHDTHDLGVGRHVYPKLWDEDNGNCFLIPFLSHGGTEI